MEYKEENNKLVKFYVKEEILMYVESFGNLIKGVWQMEQVCKVVIRSNIIVEVKENGCFKQRMFFQDIW